MQMLIPFVWCGPAENNDVPLVRMQSFPTILFCFLFLLFRQIDSEEKVSLGVESRYSLDEGEGKGVDEDPDGVPDFEEGLYTKVVSSKIAGSFSDKQSFKCPRVKPSIHTGDTVAALSPEDIDIVAAMGSSIAAGRGLWPPTDVEFRGAAFPIGGDANIDGLATIPNILLEFNDALQGVSHGMGSKDQLPAYQFNTAQSEASTKDLPQQARELVSRLQKHLTLGVLRKKWVLATITIGTEELCDCRTPSHSALRQTMGILRKGIPKVLVVLVGPLHVASTYAFNTNILRSRCQCLATTGKAKYIELIKEWRTVFHSVQDEFNNLHYSTFAVLAMTQPTIHSRDPEALLIDGKALLTRRGHMYAAKYVWNRLMAGPTFNFFNMVFSMENYFCPSVGCPYFRTVQNFANCSIMTEFEYNQLLSMTPSPSTKKPTRVETMQRRLGTIIVVVVLLCFISVTSLGTLFYCHGLKATKGRFEQIQGV